MKHARLHPHESILARLLPAMLTITVAWLAATATVHADTPVEALAVENANANNASEMKAYAEPIEHTELKIELVPIPGGEFMMGSPDTEPDRGDDEGPQRKVTISPFWMSKCEITWDQYDVWNEEIDQRMRKLLSLEPTARDLAVDGVSKPTEPYTDMSFGRGREDFPAICMTQHAARTYCKWLSAKTGRYYRLPTEAEWEYACRAGSTTSYCFGDDPDQLEDHGWFFDNSDDTYHRVGQKQPNAWGLYDMHGNVSEWVLDQYTPFDSITETVDPLVIPKTLYPRVVRGGGWDDDPEVLRSAARKPSDEEWKQQDPQVPRSIWYHTDAQSVGFRIVRPLVAPDADAKSAKWDKSEPEQLDPEE
ncbi:formylglycine-generating enzyme family protein [Stieleria sp. TO1_6]|uniref:formylglycine-generating enzyme family protein n=1 Tax=Stieleria tagensis TaxID=2956795 RepID=UPI00209B0CEE|nr:formylglycine-generating enzyme family protein [Stieleria tagensis]MCO8122964.1 formylglycine-generating enzyme family protein [Stieleria tagensis]